MNTSAIHSGNNWQQFLALSNQARMRNSGLSATTGSSSLQQKMKSGATMANASEGTPYTVSKQAGSVRYPAALPVSGSRIVGGTFDAWA